MLLNHVDCLSFVSVRASLVVVDSGYARRIAWFLEFQEVLRGNEAHNFRSGGIRDQDADSGPWTVDKCTASMALKASSSIFIECHILTHEGLLTTWIQAGLPRQRNLKKLGINSIDCSSWKREPWFSPARQAFWNDDCGRPAVSESFGIPNRIWIPPALFLPFWGISFFFFFLFSFFDFSISRPLESDLPQVRQID